MDALLLRPEVTQVVYEHAAVLQNAAPGARTRTVTLPASAHATVLSYDGRGKLVARETASGPAVPAQVVAGGFTLVRW